MYLCRLCICICIWFCTTYMLEHAVHNIAIIICKTQNLSWFDHIRILSDACCAAGMILSYLIQSGRFRHHHHHCHHCHHHNCHHHHHAVQLEWYYLIWFNLVAFRIGLLNLPFHIIFCRYSFGVILHLYHTKFYKSISAICIGMYKVPSTGWSL